MRRKFYTVLRGTTKSLTVVPEHTEMVVLQEGGAKPPFFMVDSYPYFIDVVKLLGTDQPVLSLIGQEDTQRSETYSISDEAAAHVRTILGHLPHGPFMLGGCSASGIVAYEIAQQLRALGHEIALLVMFDTHNTYFMRDYSHFWMSLASYQRDLSKLPWHKVPLWATGKASGLLARMLVRVRRKESVESAAPRSTDELGPLSSRIIAARKYRPKPFLGKVLLFKRYRDLIGRYKDPSYGWQGLVRGELEIHHINALDHNEIFQSEFDRATVARALVKAIDQVAAASCEYRSSRLSNPAVCS